MRRRAKYTTVGSAVAALACVSPVSAQTSVTDAAGALAASVQFIVTERFGGDRSDVRLGTIRVDSTVALADLDVPSLRNSVSALTGIRPHDSSQGRYCDASGFTPRWKARDPGAVIGATLVALVPDEAEVSVVYPSTYIRTLAARRVGGSWLVSYKDDSVVHAEPSGCRPPPPAGLERSEVVALLEAMALHAIERQTVQFPYSIHIGGFDDWLATLEEPLVESLRGHGFEWTSRGIDADWSGIWRHIAFSDDSDRVLVQLFSISKAETDRLLGEVEAGGRTEFPGVLECELTRGDATWRVTACETVRPSRRYPRIR